MSIIHSIKQAIDRKMPSSFRRCFRPVRFGSLRRLEPVSRSWGFDRGTPVDRYYIESFLSDQAAVIRGRVLEVGDDTYARRFGGSALREIDVLNYVPNVPSTTIVADLADAPHIPSGSFDCVIVTQTLQLIYDVPSAIRTIRRILKPGGTALVTIPGITHTGDRTWNESWYWSFTSRSAQRLFSDVFDAPNVVVKSYGNVLAATAFLQGLSAEELRIRELAFHDPIYDVTIAVCATRPKREVP